MNKSVLIIFVVMLMNLHMVPVYAAALEGSTRLLDAPLIEASSTTVQLVWEGSYFKFIPTENRTYTIYMTGSVDSVAYLFGPNGMLGSGGIQNSVNSKITTLLEANQTYYLQLRARGDDAEGTLNINGGGLFASDKTPSAPVITSFNDDTGISSVDRITNDNTLVLNGTAENNSWINFEKNGITAGSTAADASGNWLFDYTFAVLTNGTHTFTATSTDAAGNVSSFSDEYTITIDFSHPTVMSVIPSNNSTDVNVNDNVTLTFNEPVYVSSGEISLYKAVAFGDGPLVEAIDVNSAQVTGSGTTTITINPSVTLENNTRYYILIANTAFRDTAGNSYPGPSNAASWNFTTEELEHTVM